MYSKRIEQMTEENGWGDFRRVKDHKVFYTSLLLGLLTFPLSKSLMCCFRTIMYSTEAKPRKPSVVDKAKEETDKWHKSNLAVDTEGDLKTSTGDEEKEIHFIDMYLQLKLIFIISLFIFWMFTVFLSILYVVYSAQDAGEDTNPTQQALQMSEQEAYDFVKTWYMAIFLWGWLIYNGLRIYIISLLAPNQAKYEFDNQKAGDADGCCGLGRCSCSQLLFIPRESVEIGLDVYCVMDIIE